MNKYIYIFLFAGLFITSCSDSFLETEPYDQRVVENFYKTPKDAFEGLVATYDVLRHNAWGNIFFISEIASDNCFGGGGKSDGFNSLRWDRFENQNDLNKDQWSRYYRGIYRANVLLDNLDKVEWKNEESLKIQYEAETRFLRAYYYFDLVRIFENVPLITKPLNPEEYYQPQAKPDSVYQLIAKDLKFAIENLPSIPYQQMNPADYGRVTKWAAESLMGRVFLFYTDYYQKSDLAGVVSQQQVREYVDDVINNSGHDLLPSFKSLFRAPTFVDGGYAGENNKEIVFAIKYTYKGMINWDANSGNKIYRFIGLRMQNIYPYSAGWGYATVSPVLFNAYADGDTRRSATIIDIENEIPSFSASDQRQYTGYTWKKFMPTLDADGNPTVVNLGGHQDLDEFEDNPVVRFADVLLMGAELHLNGGTKAQEYLDKVRDRAFQNADNRVPATKANIIEERRFELALEGSRYWDLLRQGMDVAKQSLDYDNGDDNYKIVFRPETRGVFAIPETQIRLSNGTIVQNVGW